MFRIDPPVFGLDECRSENERQFIIELEKLSNWYLDFMPHEMRTVLYASPVDRDYNLVLRTLRVDYDGSTLWLGPDETHQFSTDLAVGQRGVSTHSDQSPIELAAIAAKWLNHELRRPIERQEWDKLDDRGVAPRLWLMADSGERICRNGVVLSEFGPPDRTIQVKQFR